MTFYQIKSYFSHNSNFKLKYKIIDRVNFVKFEKCHRRKGKTKTYDFWKTDYLICFSESAITDLNDKLE